MYRSTIRADRVITVLRWLMLGIVLVSFIVPAASADERLFGMIAKSTDDPNFVDAWRGCQSEAERHGDRCDLLGATGEAQPRRQAQAVRRAVGSHQYDALAISVTSSSVIRQALDNPSVPVITFDSPFDDANAHAQRVYVGIDNEAFGVALGRIAMKLRPQGGSVCLMSAAHDTNLADRMLGVRRALSGDDDFPQGRRLNGQGGWREPARCPFMTGDSIPRTMTEINLIMGNMRPDALISVGHWPVVNPVAYRQTVEPYRPRIEKDEHLVIVGIGKPTPEIHALMDDRLLHGFVSIDFQNMGRASYAVMRQLVEGAQLPANVVSPVHTRMVPPQ